MIEELLKEVERLATENPDAVYEGESCSYRTGKCGPSEGCILGQAARNVNPELYQEMLQCEAKLGGIDFDDIPSIVRLIPENRYAIFALQEIQSIQDVGASWGKALRKVKEIYPKLWAGCSIVS